MHPKSIKKKLPAFLFLAILSWASFTLPAGGAELSTSPSAPLLPAFLVTVTLQLWEALGELWKVSEPTPQPNSSLSLEENQTNFGPAADPAG